MNAERLPTKEQGDAMPLALARELARQGEVRLKAILSLSAIAVTRATTLCGIFGAAGVALGAAVLAYLATEHHSNKLVTGGATTGVLLLVAAGVAAYAGLPRYLGIAGGDPRELEKWSWNWDGGSWRSETEMLQSTARRDQQSIDQADKLLKLEARTVVCSLWIAAFAIVAGVVISFV